MLMQTETYKLYRFVVCIGFGISFLSVEIEGVESQLRLIRPTRSEHLGTLYTLSILHNSNHLHLEP